MSVRLLVLDLDGTLLNDHKEISQRNTEVLLKAQNEKGLRIAIGSGREVPYAERIVSCLELKAHGGFLIANNGQQICDYQNEHLMTGPKISREACSIAAGFALDHAIECHGSLKGRQYMPAMTERRAEFTDEKGNATENLDKIVFFAAGNEEQTREELAELRKHLGIMADCYLVAPHVIDVAAHGVNKAAGIIQVCKIMGIEHNEVLVIGDGENDLSSARCFPFTAMANAMDVIKDAADRITLSNEEDGVAFEVERSILNV